MNTLNTIKTGDLIVRTKGLVSTHYMVYLGYVGNIEMVAENQVGCGVRIVSLLEALANNRIKRIESFIGTPDQRKHVFAKVKQYVGKAYDLIHFNCEHFARMISNGKIESKQVQNSAVATGMVGIGWMAFTKSKELKLAGIILLLLAFIVGLSQNYLRKTATA
jgi:hypothetical protein